MCGIAGVAGQPAEISASALAQRMADAIVHRGPDDCGTWESTGRAVGLAHRRLSIVDLSPLGRNPMSRGDGRLWITFNGEIYNFLELRHELERAGHQFRSQTDTEVILAAYDEWGTDCLRRFAGMFAFALWDDARQRLWLVRDRLGKKPLYYSVRNGALSFASELKALLVDPTFPRDVDREALALYLRYGYVPAPLTIFRAARKLPPGHEAVFERGALTVRRYWDPLAFAAAPQRPWTDGEAVEELEQRLGVAVTQRMIADVPLGAFLSGGIDSSLIVALMQERSAVPVRTFTIRFDDPQYNEADFAAAVGHHLGTQHYEETCTARQLLEIVDRLPAMYDEPFADSSAIPTYLVSSIARKHVTVALSGDGGDELFFGYPRYVHHADKGWVLGLPRPIRHAGAAVASRLPHRRLRRIADVLRDDEGDQYGRFVSWFARGEVEALTRTAAPAAPLYSEMLARVATMPQAERAPLLDVVSYLPDDILAKVDRASMAVALEVRSPLLDHRVVEFALSAPMHLKRRGTTTKWLLRQLLHKRVPAALVERPKMGFGVPLAQWLRGPLRDRMNDYCQSTDFEALGIDGSVARRLWTEFAAGRPHRPDQIWQLFVLGAWARGLQAAAPVAAIAAR